MYIPKSTIETSWDYFNTIVLVLFEVIAAILAGVGAHWPECILMGAKKGLFHSCNDRKICEMLFQKDKTRLLKLLFDKGMLLSEKEEGGGGGGGGGKAKGGSSGGGDAPDAEPDAISDGKEEASDGQEEEK
jgi:uncharacterized membrane protein YgcG